MALSNDEFDTIYKNAAKRLTFVDGAATGDERDKQICKLCEEIIRIHSITRLFSKEVTGD